MTIYRLIKRDNSIEEFYNYAELYNAFKKDNGYPPLQRFAEIKEHGNTVPTLIYKDPMWGTDTKNPNTIVCSCGDIFDHRNAAKVFDDDKGYCGICPACGTWYN
jgi:hypothetical protein